jgi:UDP-glucose 4-epimerase
LASKSSKGKLVKSKWLICGDGYLGREFQKQTNALLIPREIHSHLKYSHRIENQDFLDVNLWLQKAKPSYFVNASGPSNVSDSASDRSVYEKEPVEQVREHLRMLSNLHDPPVYVYLSSAAVYGETPIHGANEATDPNPISPYGVGKLNAEEYLASAGDSGLKILIFRVFSTYSDSLQSRLPHVISRKFNENLDLRFSGTGNEMRDFIHTKDLVSAASFILTNRVIQPISTWNIGSGKSISVREIVQIAATEFRKKHSGSNYLFSFNNEQRLYDPKILVADISKLSGLGYYPRILPNIGLADYFRQK